MNTSTDLSLHTCIYLFIDSFTLLACLRFWWGFFNNSTQFAGATKPKCVRAAFIDLNHLIRIQGVARPPYLYHRGQ